MAIIPKTIINPLAYCFDYPETATLFNTGQSDQSRFDALFTALFNSLRIQALAGNAHRPDILNTIANITAHQ